jgi:hypothetical protein
MDATPKDRPKLYAEKQTAGAEARAQEIRRQSEQRIAFRILASDSLERRADATSGGGARRPARNSPLPGFGPVLNPSEINARIGEILVNAS